jgi:hypothetical protein
MNLSPPPVSQRARSVTSYALEYMQRWSPPWPPVIHRTELCALVLVAAGRGPARIPTCEQTLQHASTQNSNILTMSRGDEFIAPTLDVYPKFCDGSRDYGPKRRIFGGDGFARVCVDYFYPVLVHALLLFGPGELRALRVGDADVFRIVVDMLQALPRCAQALDSLCAIESEPLHGSDRGCVYGPHTAAIIERCAAAVTELKGLRRHLRGVSDGSENPPVLARCTRLKVLTTVSDYTPAVWLALSQLHTLHGVNLNKVSTAAIAAALPRLHTLHAFYKYNNDPKPLTDFFTDLLPRLRVLHFEGTWPVKAEQSAAAVPTAPPPLPFLEELVWQEASPQPAVLRGFLGARPIVLHVPYALLAVECLMGCGSDSGEPRSWLLARVRELRALKFCGTAPADFFGIARVLRAAPRLCVFDAEPYLRGDSSWLIKPTAPLHPAFVGFAHPRLRHLSVNASDGAVFDSNDDDCALRLRQTCFPRLRELEVSREMFFVEPAEG